MSKKEDHLEVLFEDENLLVINKPPNLVIEPTPTRNDLTLVDYLKSSHEIYLERGGVVHRLDKDTSGLLIVAKTQASLEAVQLQFKARLVKKEYTCLTHGLLKESKEISEPISRNPLDREKFVTHPQGRDAKTQFIPICHYLLTEDTVKKIYPDFNNIQLKKLQKMSYTNFTLLKALPRTGRTHQIRVHLKHIGHPIVSDEKYAGRKIYRLDHRWCPRQFLHASKITFTHPATKKTMTFESRLPQDLEAALIFLKKKG